MPAEGSMMQRRGGDAPACGEASALPGRVTVPAGGEPF